MTMLEKDAPSPFLDPGSVEVWDTWFRWREDGQLRDISIEATWERVARALANAETTASRRWLGRMIDVQARWQVVFDQRILAGAGTRNFAWPGDPVAVLNAASFVRAPFTPGARFDFSIGIGAVPSPEAAKGLADFFTNVKGTGKSSSARHRSQWKRLILFDL